MKKIFMLLLALATAILLTGCAAGDLLALLRYAAEQSNEGGAGAVTDAYTEPPETEPPTSPTKLPTPVVRVEANGELTWHYGATHQNSRKYLLEVNGVESETTKSSLEYPAHGDVIRVKAVAYGDSEVWLDSDWSEPYTFKWSRDYDFVNLGLGGEAEARLMLVESKGAGTYKIGDSRYIVCSTATSSSTAAGTVKSRSTRAATTAATRSEWTGTTTPFSARITSTNTTRATCSTPR